MYKIVYKDLRVHTQYNKENKNQVPNSFTQITQMLFLNCEAKSVPWSVSVSQEF